MRSGWATPGRWTPWPPGCCPSLWAGPPGRWSSPAESEKEYIAGLKLGVVTNTQDTTGQVLEERPVSRPTRAELEAALAAFRGDILQVPPMYSAIKIGGKKLYELARKGKEVERAPRPVTIYALEVVEQTGPNCYLLRVRCSKGTYVRTLCHDIGQALGCGGAMCSLRRTMAAGFTLEDAVSLETVPGGATGGPGAPAAARWTAYFAGTGRSRRLDGPARQRACATAAALSLPGVADGDYRVYGPERGIPGCWAAVRAAG